MLYQELARPSGLIHLEAIASAQYILDESVARLILVRRQIVRSIAIALRGGDRHVLVNPMNAACHHQKWLRLQQVERRQKLRACSMARAVLLTEFRNFLAALRPLDKYFLPSRTSDCDNHGLPALR